MCVNRWSEEIQDEGLTAAYGAGITTCFFHGCPQVTGAAWIALAEQCPDLEKLFIRDVGSFSDEHLRQVAIHCTELEDVTLWSLDNITNTGLTHLAQSQINLRQLDITGCRQVADAGIEQVARHCNLTSISLSNSNIITDLSLQYLATHCHDLTAVHVSRCEHVTDKGLEHLAKDRPNITRLGIRECNQITDAGIKAVALHCALAYVDLFGCDGLTDLSLKHLGNHCRDTLSKLEISGESFTTIPEALAHVPYLNLKVERWDNHLRQPLRNIFENQGIQGVRRYYRQLHASADPSNVIQVMLLGAPGVGKTAILRCLNAGDHSVKLPSGAQCDRTVGMERKTVCLGAGGAQARVCDCGGQSEWVGCVLGAAGSGHVVLCARACSTD